jgi:two-component system, LytTR family, response regulator
MANVMNKKTKTDIGSVVYFQASESYSLLICADGQVIMKSRPMKKYEPDLNANGWCKIHKSYIVNPNFVLSISEDRKNICLQNGIILPISRRLMTKVIKWRSENIN